VPKAYGMWAHSLAEIIWAVRSNRDTWCAIRLYHLFVHHDFEERGSTSSQPRDTKCRRRPGFGPTVSSNVIWVVRSNRDTWHVIRFYHLFAHHDFEERGSNPSHLRDAKHRKRSGIGLTTLAPGHRETCLGKRH
jgi:hypothetical protein